MKNRRLLRIALLAAAVMGVALSCGLDYTLDFELGDTGVIGSTVEVDYTLTNQGSRAMDNTTLTIRVSCLVDDLPQTMELYTPPVDLFVGQSESGTLTFTFTGSAATEVWVEVVGAGWDEHVSGE